MTVVADEVIDVAQLLADTSAREPKPKVPVVDLVGVRECEPAPGYRKAYMVYLLGDLIGSIGVEENGDVLAVLPGDAILGSFFSVEGAMKSLAEHTMPRQSLSNASRNG